MNRVDSRLDEFPRLKQLWSHLETPGGSWEDWGALEQMIVATDPLCDSGRLRGRDEVVGNKRGNLQATMSELRMAAMFAEQGHQVRMLMDSDPGFPSSGQPGVSLPDLAIERSTGERFVVEVRRIDSGDTNFTGRLHERLTDAALPYCVSAMPLGVSLSFPGTDYNSRRHYETLAHQVIEILLTRLSKHNCSGRKRGVEVIEDSDKCKHRFEFRLVEADESGHRTGYAGGGVSGGIVDEDVYAAHFIRHLEHKVEQRSRIARELAQTPYVVAVDNCCTDLTPGAVATTLIGPLTHYVWLRRSLRPYAQSTLCSMESSGWGALIPHWKAAMRPTSRSQPSPLLVSSPIGLELSGVLVNHRRRWAPQWFPNPFSRPELRAPGLLEVGFDLDPENWTRGDQMWWNQQRAPL